MSVDQTLCGCKGIRSCLLCENKKISLVDHAVKKETVVYTYCHHCNLCWSENNKKVPSPLYLSKILLIPEFISQEEEISLVSYIDKIPWMPSQSGRRKQDFGPKVNFKKKKVKIGNFQGFPEFTKDFIQRLHSRDDLVNFLPVELCHLEYTPDRGSAIEPHVDDMWLWGERLVTINLLSSTILTLSPTTNSCDMHESTNKYKKSSTGMHYYKTINSVCQHKDNVLGGSNGESVPGMSCVKSFCNEFEPRIFDDLNLSVRVVLPPRSLFVLSGCARFHWLHAIRREDVVSRRLAMTFRELSELFISENSKENKFGSELLNISKNFL